MQRRICRAGQGCMEYFIIISAMALIAIGTHVLRLNFSEDAVLRVWFLFFVLCWIVTLAGSIVHLSGTYRKELEKEGVTAGSFGKKGKYVFFMIFSGLVFAVVLGGRILISVIMGLGMTEASIHPIMAPGKIHSGNQGFASAPRVIGSPDSKGRADHPVPSE
ncbi:MAG: hypothetical protein HQM09_09880 [Candidatus Riflebacteria bacterium]|nr:hypothetical protein [Candidatus Riflebacteria bacterium]